MADNRDLISALMGGETLDTSDVLGRMPQRKPPSNLELAKALADTWAGAGLNALGGAVMAPINAAGRIMGRGPVQLSSAEGEGDSIGRDAFDAGSVAVGGAPFVERNALGSFGGKIDNPIKAYHGSPYDFDKFDASKIGTGEGAQAYGHGLYFAENPKVAEAYRDRIWPDPATKTIPSGASPDAGFVGAAEFNGSPEHWASLYRYTKTHPHGADQASWFQPQRGLFGRVKHDPAIEAGVKLAESDARLPEFHWGEGVNATPPRMYEVALHAEPQQFLDWDKPLSQQPHEVQAALGKAAAYARENYNNPDSIQSVLRAHTEMTDGGTQPMDAFGKASSEALAKAGIPGIRYKDQLSRGTEGGTSNYVVFPGSEGIIEIMRKYGVTAPVAAYMLSQQGGDQQ